MLIKAFKALFENSATQSQQQPEHTLALVAAALLYEVARADFEQDADEEAAMTQALQKAFDLDSKAMIDIQQQASAQVNEATSLYEFTRIINDYAEASDKYTIIELMWQVAYADGEISKYEEHLIRRVAELIYVAHSDFIRAKHTTLQS
ncbi:MAG: TerB family tellurite resistance protein [Halieaceae bacterium]|nr:TerB family tellurite resistance protein [Halieaceae bacterium]